MAMSAHASPLWQQCVQNGQLALLWTSRCSMAAMLPSYGAAGIRSVDAVTKREMLVWCSGLGVFRNGPWWLWLLFEYFTPRYSLGKSVLRQCCLWRCGGWLENWGGFVTNGAS